MSRHVTCVSILSHDVLLADLSRLYVDVKPRGSDSTLLSCSTARPFTALQCWGTDYPVQEQDCGRSFGTDARSTADTRPTAPSHNKADTAIFTTTAADACYPDADAGSYHVLVIEKWD
jgi:hypothetical protein